VKVFANLGKTLKLFEDLDDKVCINCT